MRRDTGYYPDTPLSLNHAIMKDKPLRPPAEAPASLPKIGAFGAAEFGTPGAMGIKRKATPLGAPADAGIPL